MSLLQCKSIEFDHVKPSLVYEFFSIQSIGMIPLQQFKEVILEKQFKICKAKTQKTWYNLKRVFFIIICTRWNNLFLLFQIQYHLWKVEFGFLPLILSQFSKRSWSGQLCGCCGPNSERPKPARDLEQQGYKCGSQGAHDHFPQVATYMQTFIGLKVLTWGSHSLLYEFKVGNCRNPTLAKCGGEAQHFQRWGFGVLRDSRMFRARQQGQNTSHWGVLGVIGKVLKRR
jgi:hypothetical protein